MVQIPHNQYGPAPVPIDHRQPKLEQERSCQIENTSEYFVLSTKLKRLVSDMALGNFDTNHIHGPALNNLRLRIGEDEVRAIGNTLVDCLIEEIAGDYLNE